MHKRPAKIQRLQLPADRRILVLSDIHANVTYFEGALALAGYCAQDELIIDGDFPTVASPNPDNIGTFALAVELAKANGADLIRT